MTSVPDTYDKLGITKLIEQAFHGTRAQEQGPWSLHYAHTTGYNVGLFALSVGGAFAAARREGFLLAVQAVQGVFCELERDPALRLHYAFAYAWHWARKTRAYACVRACSYMGIHDAYVVDHTTARQYAAEDFVSRGVSMEDFWVSGTLIDEVDPFIQDHHLNSLLFFKFVVDDTVAETSVGATLCIVRPV